MRETKRLTVNKPRTPGVGLKGRIDSRQVRMCDGKTLPCLILPWGQLNLPLIPLCPCLLSAQCHEPAIADDARMWLMKRTLQGRRRIQT